ncbi:MAG: suppressor of fused domain protein [Oscillospiraceae bacterium]|nr:suppressor of fused domain protein [Oscillospiraceae bacterium]
MNMNELIDRFNEWQENDEEEKIIEAILKLPESALDDDILGWLAGAYMNIGEYKQAIAVLENQRGRMDGDFTWHFMLAIALYNTSNEDECDEDDELRLNILRRAKVELARGMNLNPPKELLEEADRYMDLIESGLHDNDDDDDEDDFDDEDLELYDDEDIDALEEHIKEYYGDFPTVLHEINSTDIHCDIACIPPTEERNYYTLITMGMGAHLMSIPPELDEDEYGRAELLICLPPDWKVGENGNEWFWPIRLLKELARLPINSDTWLGWGHSVDNRSRYAENTDLCGALLLYPEDVEDGAEKCVLPSGDTVNFFEVIPIYRGEMAYKIDNDTHALLEKMSNVNHIVDINRPECCPAYTPSNGMLIDLIENHSKKITEKKLPLEPINGCNHIAIFMRWCIEHDLVAPEFHQYCQDVIDGVLDGTKTDIREFIAEYFHGALERPQLSFVGAAFTHYYYNWDDSDEPPFFPADVDDYAEKYFGTEKYNSEEFQDEAYMFVPFDEDYYQGLSKYIDRAYNAFYPQFASYQRDLSVDLVRAVGEKFGISGIVPNFPEDLPRDLKKAVADAKDKDYAPLLLIINDEESITSAEDLENLLDSALIPMLETIAIMKIPTHDLLVWAKEHFTVAEPFGIAENENLDELDRLCAEKLGGTPCVLTFDEKRSTLFMPVGEGRHICFIGDGIVMESEESE